MVNSRPRHHLHRYHPPWRRGVYAALLIAVVVGVGTVGLHRLERISYLDAFYVMSMIATAQGPAYTPVTPAGKLFAAVMAYLSVGTVVAALGFLFGPFFAMVWKAGVEHHDARRPV